MTRHDTCFEASANIQSQNHSYTSAINKILQSHNELYKDDANWDMNIPGLMMG